LSKPRRRNELDWPSWEDLPLGRRRDWFRRQGAVAGYQILFKEVIFDPKTQLEETSRMWQEVYDDSGKLVASHQKYPVDTGHKTV
jgi:hypothetical protein